MFSPLRKKSESERKPALRHSILQISSVPIRSPEGKGLPPGNRRRMEFIAGNSEVLRPWQQKRPGRNWLYQSQFRLQLSRKIIRIFLRIAAYPVFFAVTALELPIDCTRIPLRHLFSGGMSFPASVSESLQKIFSTNYKGAPAYATLLVTQLYRYLLSLSRSP